MKPSAMLLALWAGLATADTRYYNWRAGWVERNPDGMFVKRTMAINGQWPPPTVNINKGDRVIVNFTNDLGDRDTSLHWHGLFQYGTSHMDGPVGVSQCGIPPGHSFIYNFTVEQPGTYWYHSHQRGQYPDGLRGAFIVHDQHNPFKGKFDKELVMSVSDWYHQHMPDLIANFISLANPTGAEPVPNSALMNDTQDLQIPIQPDTTYFFRILNVGAFAGQYIWFEDHEFDIIEVDGVYTEPQRARAIYITPAQRYGLLLKTKKEMNKNFPIVGSMDLSLFDTVPPALNPNVTGWLVYDDKKELPKAKKVTEFHDYDDVQLHPHDGEPILPEPDHIINMTMSLGTLSDGANYAFIDGKSYTSPLTPTIYTTLTSGNMSTDPTIYGNTNPFILKYNDVVELRFNNDDSGKHPFHLHGHNFQAVYRSQPFEGFYNATIAPPSSFHKFPMRRDTMWVRPMGNYVIRFRANNPGIWLWHCHIEWHIDAGLVATMIEAPPELQAQLQGKIPQNHFDTCRAQGLPISGNAAGNQELLNLDGVPAPPPPLPAGFTTRGIVALVFSCISAFLGMVVIGFYGVKPIGSSEFTAARDRIKKAGL